MIGPKRADAKYVFWSVVVSICFYLGRGWAELHKGRGTLWTPSTDFLSSNLTISRFGINNCEAFRPVLGFNDSALRAASRCVHVLYKAVIFLNKVCCKQVNASNRLDQELAECFRSAARLFEVLFRRVCLCVCVGVRALLFAWGNHEVVIL